MKSKTLRLLTISQVAKAEKLVVADLAPLEDLTPDQMHGLIRELQVHQIELPM